MQGAVSVLVALTGAAILGATLGAWTVSDGGALLATPVTERAWTYATAALVAAMLVGIASVARRA